jgi:hypothetical protein
LLGAAVVARFFPRLERENELLGEYQAENAPDDNLEVTSAPSAPASPA